MGECNEVRGGTKGYLWWRAQTKGLYVGNLVSPRGGRGHWSKKGEQQASQAGNSKRDDKSRGKRGGGENKENSDLMGSMGKKTGWEKRGRRGKDVKNKQRGVPVHEKIRKNGGKKERQKEQTKRERKKKRTKKTKNPQKKTA